MMGARIGRVGRPAQVRSLGCELSVCGALSEQEIVALADLGVRTIVDLRGPGEPISGLRPEVEREIAARAGIAYEHMPMGGNPVDTGRINDLRVLLWSAEPRILLHCSSGRRAALCAMIHLGCQSGWTIDQCLDFAVDHGIDFDQMPAMRDYLRDYLQRNSRAYTAGLRRPSEASYQI